MHPPGLWRPLDVAPLHRSSNREADSSYASPCIPLSCRKRSCCELRRREEASRRCLCPGEHHLLELFCLSCRALRINDLQRKVSKLLDKSKVLTIACYNSGSNRATAEGHQDIIEQACCEFAAKLRCLFEHNRNDASYLFPGKMAGSDDTSNTLKEFIESGNRSSLPGGTGSSKEFLHND
jgi:hypothetical protein